MIIVVAVIIIIVLIVVWGVTTYNGINIAKLKVQEALSGIDVALTKRYDMLTKMLDAVKSYNRHEEQLFTEVIKLRTGMSMQERKAVDEQMNRLSEKVNLMVENYPDLKASNNVIELQKAIAGVEEHLQASRRIYNANVSDYNAKLIVFPASIVAKMMGAQCEEFFEADDYKRADIKIDF